jgi:hypothetical protein
MTFEDPAVQAVFAEYAQRLEADALKMRTLGAEDYARRDEFLLPVGEQAGWLLHSLIVLSLHQISVLARAHRK